MTESGELGLGIDIIEAVLERISSILIDPKRDMGNLLFALPELQPEDFEPWIEPAGAEAKGMIPVQYSQKVVHMWQEESKNRY